jgi:ribosomal protein L3 glutamine methyltransferase
MTSAPTPANSTSISGSTIADLVASGAASLTAAGVAFGHGTATAEDEAAWLTLWKLGLPLDSELTPGAPESIASQGVSAQQQAEVAELVSQRIRTRKPAAYLTQEAWLQGVPFYVDERAIVPRSFIAELLADGSLACLAAMAWPEVEVTGADISADALAVARINVDRHELGQRVQLLESDGLAALPGPWDLVLCNPPYVNADSMSRLPAEYQAEPELALAGGSDGMDFIRRLLEDLPSRLAKEAVVVLEIGNEKPFFEAAFPDLPVFWLDTSSGDEQVLLITQEALKAWADGDIEALRPTYRPLG